DALAVVSVIVGALVTVVGEPVSVANIVCPIPFVTAVDVNRTPNSRQKICARKKIFVINSSPRVGRERCSGRERSHRVDLRGSKCGSARSRCRGGQWKYLGSRTECSCRRPRLHCCRVLARPCIHHRDRSFLNKHHITLEIGWQVLLIEEDMSGEGLAEGGGAGDEEEDTVRRPGGGEGLQDAEVVASGQAVGDVVE